MPVSMLGHVPSATIVVHRSAVGAGFAPGLRVGEDVDLCMRLHEAGWRLRSVPDVRVGHRHRTDLRGRLTQRAGYGTGAADMALRHPGRVPPLSPRPGRSPGASDPDVPRAPSDRRRREHFSVSDEVTAHLDGVSETAPPDTVERAARRRTVRSSGCWASMAPAAVAVLPVNVDTWGC
ncbi:glycosyltransferase family 2 protein [Streptomyces sp. NPDC001034]|uniref:glycosyltransferase family 2 protein n=1 Tax=Streptomyces sp. NPDC001034 TaxID=3154375 RepID=UPI00331F4484